VDQSSARTYRTRAHMCLELYSKLDNNKHFLIL